MNMTWSVRRPGANHWMSVRTLSTADPNSSWDKMTERLICGPRLSEDAALPWSWSGIGVRFTASR